MASAEVRKCESAELTGAVVQIMYSCVECGLQKVPANVTARGQEQDVSEWVKVTLATAVAVDHHFRSPQCLARKISEVYIPVTGVNRIGNVGGN